MFCVTVCRYKLYITGCVLQIICYRQCVIGCVLQSVSKGYITWYVLYTMCHRLCYSLSVTICVLQYVCCVLQPINYEIWVIVCVIGLLYNDMLWVVMNMLCFVSFLLTVCWNLHMPGVEIYTFSVNLVLMICWNLCIPYGKNWNLHIAWLFR